MIENIPMRCVEGWWLHDWASGGDWINIAEVYQHDVYQLNQIAPYRPDEVIVDVGANVGAFTRKVHERNPTARIISVEVAPENISVLQANVGSIASVVQGAMTYEKDLALLNSVFPDSHNTGGSIVCQGHDIQNHEQQPDPRYKLDRRPITRYTLEDIFEQFDIDRIDILKLDCEGSEFSILENTTSLDRIEMIIGEYHGWNRFNDLCIRRFRPDWHLTVLHGGDLGIFWLNRWRNVKRNGVQLPPGYLREKGIEE